MSGKAIRTAAKLLQNGDHITWTKRYGRRVRGPVVNVRVIDNLVFMDGPGLPAADAEDVAFQANEPVDVVREEPAPQPDVPGTLLDLCTALRDLAGQLIEGRHAPNRAQLLRALDAIDRGNAYVPEAQRIGDTERLRERVRAGMPGSA